MSVLTLNSVVTNLNNIADAHLQINSFYFGEMSDFAVSGVTQYPAMAVTLQPSAYQSNVLIQSFRVYVMSMVQKRDTTRLETLSDMQLVLLDILAQLRDSQVYEWSVQTDNVVLNDFVDDFDGECAGYWFTLNLKIPNALSQCAAPYNPVAIQEPIDNTIPDRDSMILSIDTTNAGSASNTFILPLFNTGVFNCVIDWGDDTTDTITAYNDVALTHVYDNEGVYTVKVNGLCPHISFNNGGDKLKLTGITQWGTIAIAKWDSAFYGCSNLIVTATDTPNTSAMTSAVLAFRSVPQDLQLSEIPFSNVLDAGAMFRSTLVDSDFGSLDISSLLAASSMFLSSAMSSANIDATLIGWAAQAPNIQNNVPVAFSPNNRTAASDAAVTLLTGTFGWTITA